jgi:hypothetical protein
MCHPEFHTFPSDILTPSYKCLERRKEGRKEGRKEERKEELKKLGRKL